MLTFKYPVSTTRTSVKLKWKLHWIWIYPINKCAVLKTTQTVYIPACLSSEENEFLWDIRSEVKVKLNSVPEWN